MQKGKRNLRRIRNTNDTISTRKNKQLVLQLFEAGDRQDIESMEQLVSTTNYTLHFSGMPTMDWNGHKQFLAAINSAFADIHHDLGDILAEGEDKVAVRWNNITATHIGDFQGIPPSGKKVSFGAMHFLTIKDGKIVEHWINADMMGLMQQIGAIPTVPP